MISRFNFYDVYGYFLPGLVLLTLLWLPFGIIDRVWPSGELLTALVAIPFAYIAGHVLQTMAVPAFPSTEKDSQGNRRYPSDVILDPEDKTFSPAFKDKLAGQIKTLFDIEVTGEPPTVSARRQDAFFLCSCSSSAMSSGRLFLDRVARQQSPSLRFTDNPIIKHWTNRHGGFIIER